jgi:SpoVK/Ycf46/Vps4 family AAA+-type ATPase
MFDQVRERQAARIIAETDRGSQVKGAAAFNLERDDILGPKITDLSSGSVAWTELERMTGLQSVKNSIQSLFSLVQTNLELEEEEKPQHQVSLNRLFLGISSPHDFFCFAKNDSFLLGNPGTGKTTVAALYGRILAELGLLSKGEVKIHNASEFVGAVLGASEEKTRKLLKGAEGCVLVIDEAYGLYAGKSGDIYKTAVLNTIVEEVQNRPGEDK